jgi:hypothetical protein
MEKHSSLLRKFVNYGRIKFYDTGPWCQHFEKNGPKIFVPQNRSQFLANFWPIFGQFLQNKIYFGAKNCRNKMDQRQRDQTGRIRRHFGYFLPNQFSPKGAVTTIGVSKFKK